jgi:hypothetical protein
MRLAADYGGLMHVSGAKPIASMEEFEQNQIRDLYIREIIFNIGDKIDYIKENLQGKVVRRGTNYVVLEDNNNIYQSLDMGLYSYSGRQRSRSERIQFRY